MEVLYVRAHSGNVGNEKVDALAKKGAKLRARMMILEGGDGWYKRTVERYWENRK